MRTFTKQTTWKKTLQQGTNGKTLDAQSRPPPTHPPTQLDANGRAQPPTNKKKDIAHATKTPKPQNPVT